MESELKSKEGDGVIRHCAYCLQLCGIPAKLCGGCKKRAYCSRDCQIADWSSKGDGQHHVKWCRHYECGEEDVDWEVVPILSKGLGIRAKKLIPAGFKIIVEPCFSSCYDHQGIKDLSPEGGTLEDKFNKNTFYGEYFPETLKEPTVALRIARVNHACQPNAAAIYDETANAAILFAQRDIQPGEEISVCYYFPFFWLMPNESFRNNNQEELNFCKNRIASKYGIICAPDCFCYDPTFLALTEEGRQLYKTVMTLARQQKIEEALDAGDKLLDVYRRLNVSWSYRGYTCFNLFEIAVRKSETLLRAKQYIQSAAELFEKMCPYSEKLTKKFEKLLEHPELNSNYLVLD